MNYIFNASGKCVASCDYEPNTEDLVSRNEIVVASETNYDISTIKLVDGVITVITHVITHVETLDEAKKRYINAAKNYRDSQEVAPIAFNGNTFDYDAKARERLLIARTAIEDAGGTGTIEWTLADQSRIAISLDDFKGINATAAARSNTLHVNYSNTKAALQAASSIEVLEQIYPLRGE